MREFENPDHWDTTARHYEQTAHPFTARYAEATLARVTLTAEARVLDVAAGTGALALAAARTGGQVLATDFSPGMVARIAAARLPNVEARVMDGQKLDLPDASFDAVFSIFGVIMFPDWRKGLAEMARVTRPGGHGAVATWQSRGAATFLLLGHAWVRLIVTLLVSAICFYVVEQPFNNLKKKFSYGPTTQNDKSPKSTPSITPAFRRPIIQPTGPEL